MNKKATLLLLILTSFIFNVNSQTFEHGPEIADTQINEKWQILEGEADLDSFKGESVIILNDDSIITPNLGSLDYLSDNFTVNFDAYFDIVQRAISYQTYEVRLWSGIGKVAVSSSKGEGYYGPIAFLRHGIRLKERIGDSEVISHQEFNNLLKGELTEGVWRSIKIAYRQGNLKLLIDEQEVYTINSFKYKPTMISIGAQNTESKTPLKKFLKNIRIEGINAVSPNQEETETETTEENNPLNGNYTYSLPKEDGLPNQILQTDGNGIVSWADDNPNNQFNTNETPNTNAISLNDLIDGKYEPPPHPSIFLGFGSGEFDDGGNYNVGLGHETLASNTSGNNNSAVGFRSLKKNTAGSINTALGADALYNNTIGKNNIAVGGSALFENEKASNNIAIGVNSLNRNKDGNHNISIGNRSNFYNLSGEQNVAIGFESMFKNSDGRLNTALGHKALRTNESNFNTAIGGGAMQFNSSGYNNTALGISSLSISTSGHFNTAIGSNSLLNSTTGTRNTATGHNSLSKLTTGSNNIGIGFEAQVPSATGNHQVRIGNSQILYAGIQVPWTVTSDKFWKDNIRDLPYGVETVMRLRPVDYVRKSSNKKSREMGFIAQDVEQVLKSIGYTDQGFLTKDDEGKLSLRYNDLIALLTKAIQDQQDIIDNQNSKINTLTQELTNNEEALNNLNKRVKQIESLLNPKQL